MTTATANRLESLAAPVRPKGAVAAIETKYAGVVFRSRLEARWAHFFDALGVTWHYEPQPYTWHDDEAGRRFNYLPDFWVEGWQIGGEPFDLWVEVKGGTEALAEDLPKIMSAARHLPQRGQDDRDGRMRPRVLVLTDLPKAAGENEDELTFPVIADSGIHTEIWHCGRDYVARRWCKCEWPDVRLADVPEATAILSCLFSSQWFRSDTRELSDALDRARNAPFSKGVDEREQSAHLMNHPRKGFAPACGCGKGEAG